jgi:hypothetical protein
VPESSIKRGGGHAPLGDCLGIQKGLEGGAGLAQRGDAIHLGRRAERARRAHPGQHLAAGVVQHHQRAIFNMAPGQFAQVLLQRLYGKALQGRAQAWS